MPVSTLSQTNFVCVYCYYLLIISCLFAADHKSDAYFVLYENVCAKVVMFFLRVQGFEIKKFGSVCFTTLHHNGISQLIIS